MSKTNLWIRASIQKIETDIKADLKVAIKEASTIWIFQLLAMPKISTDTTCVKAILKITKKLKIN